MGTNWKLTSLIMKLACFLRSQNNYLPIELPDGKGTILGRNARTKIRSKSVSRNQLEIIPDYQKRTATVKQLGPNKSSVNDNEIRQGLDLVAKEGDVIRVLAGTDEFDYKLCFEEIEEKDREMENHGEMESKTDTGISSKSSTPDSTPVKIPKMFLPKSARAAELRKDNIPRGTWETTEGGKVLVYLSDSSLKEPKSKIYAFDLDGTIITTKSGRVFPKDDNDWKFLHGPCISKIQKISSESNAKVVIFSNQAGIHNGTMEADGFKKKIETIVRQISAPLLVFVMTGKNEYRKPLPTVWNLFVRSYNGGVTPAMESSVYCGDAAGRKKDHSKSDRLFALNIGVQFCTPEEFFLGQKPQPFEMPSFDPKKFLQQFDSSDPPSNDHIKFYNKQEVIIMVGYPASGKSHFVRSLLLPRGYVHVNRDTLKTAAKCKTLMVNSLEKEKSVVVDNTNPCAKDREEYLKLASKYKVPCRCFIMSVSYEHALHNNKFRELILSDHEKVPEVAFNSFRSKFEKPSDAEGFTEILDVNFIPAFESEEYKRLYSLYLLEK